MSALNNVRPHTSHPRVDTKKSALIVSADLSAFVILKPAMVRFSSGKEHWSLQWVASRMWQMRSESKKQTRKTQQTVDTLSHARGGQPWEVLCQHAADGDSGNIQVQLWHVLRLGLHCRKELCNHPLVRAVWQNDQAALDLGRRNYTKKSHQNQNCRHHI